MYINIDWLSVSFLGSIQNDSKLTFKKMDYSDRNFSYIYECFDNFTKVGTLCSDPKSPVLNSLLNIFKFENAILYSDEFKYYLSMILFCRTISKIQISRIDLCTDFNTFLNKYDPEYIITLIASKRLLKKGKSQIKIIGRNNKGLTYDYLKFGTYDSPVSFYLYNKSIELKTVKDKKYIRDLWKHYDIDINKNVWRLEFSIKPAGIEFVDIETGEFNLLQISKLTEFKYLHDLFISLIYQYFTFVRNTGNERKDRMKIFDLFKLETFKWKLYKIKDSITSNRSDKVFINFCLQSWQNLREENKYKAEQYLFQGKRHSINKHLEEYFNTKKYYIQKKSKINL